MLWPTALKIMLVVQGPGQIQNNLFAFHHICKITVATIIQLLKVYWRKNMDLSEERSVIISISIDVQGF